MQRQGAIAPQGQPITVQITMEPLFGVFPVPDAERQDAVVEQVLLADRLGLDLWASRTTRTSAATSTPGRS